MKRPMIRKETTMIGRPSIRVSERERGAVDMASL
jgi:hypothetical protein